MTESTRILVVDDEELARQRIVRYLGETGRSLIIEEAESGLRAVEMIRSFQPDVVFLDVEMPGLSGFEVLQQFDERPFHVIFETAYDEFAIRAFEEQACDYLLKPFTSERLSEALARALSRTADGKRLRALEAQLVVRDGYLRRLGVRHGNKMRIVEESEILCFVSRDHYTYVYFGEGHEGMCDLSLSSLTSRLNPSVFQQLHRNNIVRVSAIASLLTKRNGEMEVELAGGMLLPVSRSHRKRAKEMVGRLAQS